MVSLKVGVNGFVCDLFDEREKFLGNKKKVDSAVFIIVESFPGKSFKVLVSFSIRVNKVVFSFGSVDGECSFRGGLCSVITAVKVMILYSIEITYNYVDII